MAFYRSFLLIIFLGGSSFLLPAQNNYQVQRFTTDNRLPSNGIKGLKWDTGTGILWIATEAGVTRYNGSDFVIFSKTNIHELIPGKMLFMLMHQKVRIYTADES